MIFRFIVSNKKSRFVLLTCLRPFLATKGSRVLEKKVNEKQVLKLCLESTPENPDFG